VSRAGVRGDAGADPADAGGAFSGTAVFAGGLGGVCLHEWAVAEDGDVEDMEVVKAANPFSGMTVEVLREKRESPTMTLEHWRRFVCNLPTRSGSAAINEAEWFAAETRVEIPVGEPVWLGLDVAWKWDTTSAVPLWFRDERFRVVGRPEVLVPPRDGTSLDPHAVEAALVRLHERNPIHTVVMDMSKAEQLSAWIQAELGALVIERGQSNKAAAEDYEAFMEALREGWLRHVGDPVMTRHALNAVIRILPYGDARFERPMQSRSGGEQDRRVIDALTAAAMANFAAATFAVKPKSRVVSW
jgi:phage terminase large subunit-like protein